MTEANLFIGDGGGIAVDVINGRWIDCYGIVEAAGALVCTAIAKFNEPYSGFVGIYKW